jgi:hypothetical protein
MNELGRSYEDSCILKKAASITNVTGRDFLEVRMSTTPQRAAHASVPTQAPSTDLKRRRFLLALGAGSAGAASAAAKPLTAVADPAVNAGADTAQGYRETEHVRDYYASARL